MAAQNIRKSMWVVLRLELGLLNRLLVLMNRLQAIFVQLLVLVVTELSLLVLLDGWEGQIIFIG